MDNEIIKTVCNSAVWIVGIITFGKLGMFAMRHYLPKPQTLSSHNKYADKAADALNRM